MKVLYIFLVSFILISSAVAQQSYSISTNESSVVVKGTSSAHDWESNAEDFTGSAIFTITDGVMESLEALSFSIKAESIKSGKRIMDNKTKDALDAKDHPQITFEFISLEGIDNDTVWVKGNLSLAGVTNEVMLTGVYELGENGSVWVSGSQPVDMEGYNIKPPTAMMGALKTGKDVNVEYRIKFSQN
ncbi:MAG: YceI family protein [Balneola sp.]